MSTPQKRSAPDLEKRNAQVVVVVVLVLCCAVYIAAGLNLVSAAESPGKELKNILTWVSLGSGVGGLLVLLSRKSFWGYVSKASGSERVGLFLAVLGLASGALALFH